jgi:hypothetical protein
MRAAVNFRRVRVLLRHERGMVERFPGWHGHRSAPPPSVTTMPPIDTLQVRRKQYRCLQFALPPHATPMRHRVKHIARIPSSPPADHCLASDGHSSQTTELLENLMSFLQQSDLKKHLSTRSGNMSTHDNEAVPPGGSRVILRDGNLITLPLGEEVVETARIDRANT